MSNFIFIAITGMCFGFFMAAIGYSVVERPDVFIPAVIIFSFFCALMVNK